MTGPTEFRFLNKTGDLAGIGWDGEGFEKLWRYNQHYFDDLNAIGAPDRRDWHSALIERWIAENPAASGTGWEPYPASLRLVNWVKWALAGNPRSAAFHHSIAVQARWLSRRLERHLLGNHLFANAKALIFAGTLLGGAEGDEWHRIGTRILMREIPRQILPDGGHFELTPMYHALALEDMLDLVNILRTGGGGQPLLAMCERRIPAMRQWLAAMTHPDGDIAFFNDAAIGVAPAGRELDGYARRLGFDGIDAPAGVWLADSGYARAESGDAVLLADMAPVGPSYLPGHAHADTLSFEFSIGGHRVLTNGGTSVYGLSEERLRQRSTAAHNCVVVDGRNSSDVWSGFRVGQRARVLTPEARLDNDHAVLRAGHDGYRSLPGRPLHWRQWTLDATSLRIEDELTTADANAVAHFHFHPDVVIEPLGADHGTLTLPDGRRLDWRAAGGTCRLIDSHWHPEFGVDLPTRSILLTLHGARSALHLSWR